MAATSAAEAKTAETSGAPSTSVSATQSLTHEQFIAAESVGAADAAAPRSPEKLTQVFEPEVQPDDDASVDASASFAEDKDALHSHQDLYSPTKIVVDNAAAAPRSPAAAVDAPVSPASAEDDVEEDIEEDFSASQSFIGADDAAQGEAQGEDESLRPVPVSPRAPVRALTLEERDHVLAEGPDAAADFAKEPSPRHLAVPAASASSPTKPRAGRARLAELEAAAREQQDAELKASESATSSLNASTDSIQAADTSATDAHAASAGTSAAAAFDEAAESAAERKDALVSAVTLALLQDLTRELKESTEATQAAKQRRRQAQRQQAEKQPSVDTAAAAASADASADAPGVMEHLQADLVAETLLEVERIEKLKREREQRSVHAVDEAVEEMPPAESAAASPIPTVESPMSSISASPQQSAASSASMSPLSSVQPHYPGLVSIDSPLGLRPVGPEVDVRSVDEWALDSSPSSSGDLEVPGLSLSQKDSSTEQLNAAVEAALAAKRAEEAAQARAQTHLAPAYVTQLLSSMFKMEMHALEPAVIPQAAGLSEEARARMLPPLREDLLPRVETTLAEQLAASGAGADDPPQLVATRAAFHRLLLATANQYVDSYNTAVRRAELSLALPWGASAVAVAASRGDSNEWHASDEEDDYNASDSFGPDEEEVDGTLTVPLMFSLANSRVRRAPGGLVISLKGHERGRSGASGPSSLVGEESAEQQRKRWSRIVMRKVGRKVAQMRACMQSTQSAMTQALTQAATAAANAAAAADPSSSSSIEPSTEQRLKLQAVLEQENLLVNGILTRQMASVEPGPAGAAQKDWSSLGQHGLGAAAAASSSAAAAAPSINVEDSLDLTGLSSYDESMLSQADTARTGDLSAHSSVLYSGSESEWEGGYEASERAALVAELAEHVPGLLLAEQVTASHAVEQKKYTRRLLSRAKEREEAERQLYAAAAAAASGAQDSSSARASSPTASSTSAPHSASLAASDGDLSPRDAAERKKARRQAIKL